jgi:NTE family protein
MYYESRQGEEAPDKMVMLLNATFNNLSGRGSWWSTDFQFVNVLKLRTQYLQPLGKGFFLLPEAYYDDDFQTVYRDQEAIANYDVKETGVSLYLGTLFTKLGFVAAGYNWERADVEPTIGLDPEEFPYFDESIGSLVARSTFDRLDRFPFPHSGGLLELNYQWAAKEFGGDVDYHKLSIEAWRYFPLATRHTLGLHLLAGSDFDTDLRPYKKFLVGGRESFVGYKVEELRGANVGTASLEYRYQLTKLPSPLGGGVYTTLIGNIGNVWQSWDELEEDLELRYGGSIGLGVDSILGPITADYSLGDEGRQIFYVNIGLKF